MITYDHTLLLCLGSIWSSTASIWCIHLCPAAIGRKTVHSSCQSRLISACILNPSYDMGDQLVLVVLSRTDRAGGAPLFICQELCAYWVLSNHFQCIVWERGPLRILKVMGDIWDVNSIFMCTASPSKPYLEVSSSTSSTSSSVSSATDYVIETSTSSAATVSTVSSINTTLSEAAWWRVGRWIGSCNHYRQVSGCFENFGQKWWPTNVDFCLQLCVW